MTATSDGSSPAAGDQRAVRHDWEVGGGSDWTVVTCRRCGRYTFGHGDRWWNLLGRIWPSRFGCKARTNARGSS